jgi:hypothetical protein
MAKKKSPVAERTLLDDIIEETFAQLSTHTDFDVELLQELKIAFDSGKLTKAIDIQSLIQKAASRNPNETA